MIRKLHRWVIARKAQRLREERARLAAEAKARKRGWQVAQHQLEALTRLQMRVELGK